MTHEIAKLLLEHAGTAIERADAVKSAIYLGMSLQEIEEYLDWLDAVRGPVAPGTQAGNGTDGNPDSPSSNP
jgi:hypothetical protein